MSFAEVRCDSAGWADRHLVLAKSRTSSTLPNMEVIGIVVQCLVALGTILLAAFTFKLARSTSKSVDEGIEDRKLTAQALAISNRIAESTKAQAEAMTELVNATRDHIRVGRDAMTREAAQAERSYQESLKTRVDTQAPVVVVEFAERPPVSFSATLDGRPTELSAWVEHSRQPRWRCTMEMRIAFHNFGASPGTVFIPTGPLGIDYQSLPVERWLLLKPGETEILKWQYGFTNLSVEGFLAYGGWAHSSPGWLLNFEFTSNDTYGSVFDTHRLDASVAPFEQDGSRFRVAEERVSTRGVAVTERDYPKLRRDESGSGQEG